MEFFRFDEEKNHRPNGTRIAFWTKLVRDAGGKNLEGREACEGYSPALRFFEIARALVRFDHVASVIVDANHGVTALEIEPAED